LLHGQVGTDDETEQKDQPEKAVDVGTRDDHVDGRAQTALLAKRREYSLTNPQPDHYQSVGERLTRDDDDPTMSLEPVSRVRPVENWNHLAQDQSRHRRLGECRVRDRVLLDEQLEQQEEQHERGEEEHDLRYNVTEDFHRHASSCRRGVPQTVLECELHEIPAPTAMNASVQTGSSW